MFIKFISFAKKLALKILTFLFSVILLSSCSNKLETIQSIMASDTIPILYSKNFFLKRTDSGRVVLIAQALIVKYMVKSSDTITLFPNGITVETFSDYPLVESKISANYAKHYGSKDLWEAKNNVVAINYKGDTLYTELLYWDEKRKLIYSNKFCKIITEDGLLIGKNGFEADESLTRWKVINTQGTVNVKDE